MLFVYPAIFHKEDDAYWVEFPDLEGCHTYGSSINETMKAAQEALAAYLLTLLEQEKEIASPSDISVIHVDNGFSSLVSCDINQYKDTKAVKKTLTIPSSRIYFFHFIIPSLHRQFRRCGFCRLITLSLKLI